MYLSSKKERTCLKQMPQTLSKTAPQTYKRTRTRQRTTNKLNVTSISPPNNTRNKTNLATTRTTESQKGEPVLLLDNRFYRPGGIRVGTMEKMMFRPGLAPDHNSPPPAFRATTRITTIPYSKGSKYRAKIGIDKLATSSKTNPTLQSNAQKKIITMFGGDPEKISKQIATRKLRSNTNTSPTSTTKRVGGRATKLINGKETKAESFFSRPRPKSRLNWNRLAIEKSSGTITGAYSACSVPQIPGKHN